MNTIRKPMGVATGSALAVDDVSAPGVSDVPVSSGTCYATKPGCDPMDVTPYPDGPRRVNGSILTRTVTPAGVRCAFIRPSIILPAYEKYVCKVIGEALGSDLDHQQLGERILPFLPPTVWNRTGCIYEPFLDLAVPRIVENFPECEITFKEAVDDVKAALRKACVVEDDFDPAGYYQVALVIDDAYEARFELMHEKFKDRAAVLKAENEAKVMLLRERLEGQMKAIRIRLEREMRSFQAEHEEKLERLRGQHERKVRELESTLERVERNADHQRFVASKSRSLARRLAALRDLVRQLGVVQDANQEVGLTHMKTALGVRFGKVFEVDTAKGTWWNPKATDVKERYAQPSVPEDGSGKALVSMLWASKSLPMDIQRAIHNGEIEWERFDGWAYLRVPVLEKRLSHTYSPLRYRRQGEIMYVVVGGKGDSGLEVYSLTSPMGSEAILSKEEKQEDLRVLGAIVAAMITAKENAHHVKRLHELTSLDGLTQIFNRRYFDEMMEKEFDRSKRSGLPLSVLLFDIDHFKSVNDTYGHQAGDEILRQVAATLKGVVREGDILARYGGEEFVIIAPDTDEAGAVELAERVRLAIEALRTEFAKQVIPVTISIGVSTHTQGADTSYADQEALIGGADKAVYSAKDNGRNQVVHSSSLE